MIWTAASGKYVSSTFSYRVQLMTATGTLLKETTTPGLQWTTTDDLEVSTVYQWRVRPEIGTYLGPWSSTASFKTVDKPTAFLRGNELYDPLIDGTTLGTIARPGPFRPGCRAGPRRG